MLTALNTALAIECQQLRSVGCAAAYAQAANAIHLRILLPCALCLAPVQRWLSEVGYHARSDLTFLFDHVSSDCAGWNAAGSGSFYADSNDTSTAAPLTPPILHLWVRSAERQ